MAQDLSEKLGGEKGGAMLDLLKESQQAGRAGISAGMAQKDKQTTQFLKMSQNVFKMRYDKEEPFITENGEERALTQRELLGAMMGVPPKGLTWKRRAVTGDYTAFQKNYTFAKNLGYTGSPSAWRQLSASKSAIGRTPANIQAGQKLLASLNSRAESVMADLTPEEEDMRQFLTSSIAKFAGYGKKAKTFKNKFAVRNAFQKGDITADEAKSELAKFGYK